MSGLCLFDVYWNCLSWTVIYDIQLFCMGHCYELYHVTHPPMVYFLFAFNQMFLVMWLCKYHVWSLKQWHVVSSMNDITKIFHIYRKMLCIFKYTFWQLANFIHRSYAYGYIVLVYKNILFDIPKLKLCSIDPEFCMIFFVFCHVMEDKCWSFKWRMRLKCTARKECIKYINKYTYLNGFLPKWPVHHGGAMSLNSYEGVEKKISEPVWPSKEIGCRKLLFFLNGYDFKLHPFPKWMYGILE